MITVVTAAGEEGASTVGAGEDEVQPLRGRLLEENSRSHQRLYYRRSGRRTESLEEEELADPPAIVGDCSRWKTAHEEDETGVGFGRKDYSGSGID